MYYIEIVKPKDGVISVFQKSTCSFPKFLSIYKCKHLLCLLYRKCHITISDDHKCVQFGKPRRRVRPRLNNIFYVLENLFIYSYLFIIYFYTFTA